MFPSLLAGLTSFLVAFVFLPFIIKFSKKKKLVAHPGRRRIHKRITPSLGGVAIFFGFTIGTITFTDQAKWSDSFFLVPVLIIPFIIGLLDDLIHLKPLAKLIAQLITATLIFFVLNIRLSSLYGFFGDAELPEPLAYLITVVTVVIITNSLNLIDGIDGLAGVFSLIATLFFGSWFFFTGKYQYAILSFALAGGIFAFLFQNWEPSTIFMGDTGSLVIGTMLSILMIQFINLNHGLPSDHVMRFNSSIGTAICVMSISLIDTIRIIIIRMARNISPLKADKRHIHHALIRLNLSHSQAVCILALVQVLFIGLAIAFHNVDNGYLVSIVIFVATMLCLILEKFLADYFSRKGDPQIKQEEV